VAGDVTGNGALSALDASYIARFAVGLVDHFPVAITNQSDWKFEKCVPAYPGDCGAPAYSFNPFTEAQTGKNFYALLYGEVTGNWPAPGQFAMTKATTSEEQLAQAKDLELAARYRREGPPRPVERRGDAGPAVLSLSGWKALRAGERRQLTLDLRNADGILGRDLTLAYDARRFTVVSIEAAGIGIGLSVVRADRPGESRLAAYGLSPLSGSGAVLKITVEALKNTGRRDAPSIGAVANEGVIPLRVRG
jgi:hypothetical protein